MLVIHSTLNLNIEKRESKSRPDEGIVTVKTIGKNQDGVQVTSL